MTMTMLKNLINPEVLGDFAQSKLVDNIKFAPLADIGTKLQGQPGNTLTMPVWKYIGDAKDLAEGEADTPTLLQATSSKVTVKKAVKSVELTDESVLSGYGDPVGQSGTQLAIAIGSKIDNDVLEALSKVDDNRKHTSDTPLNKDVVADAVIKFGEDIDDEMFLYISPAQYATLRKDKDFTMIQNGIAKITGEVGMIYGVRVILTNKIKEHESKFTNYIIKRGALGIELKRGMTMEDGRQILTKSTIISADQHYVAYVKDESKVVKIECPKEGK